MITIGIYLESDRTGLTLNGQFVGASGQNIGDPITTGFIEIGSGVYVLRTAIPAGDIIGLKVYEAEVPNVVLAFATIDALEQRRWSKLDLINDKTFITVTYPFQEGKLFLVKGGSYTVELGNAIVFTDDGTWPSLAGFTAKLYICGAIEADCTIESGPPQRLIVELSATQTNQLPVGQSRFDVWAIKGNNKRVLLGGPVFIRQACGA